MQSVVLETSMGEIQLELYWVRRRPHPAFIYPLRSSPESRAQGLSPSSRADDAHRLTVAAQTCKNFADLTSRGYYNGTVFHRIIVVRTRPALSARAHADGAGHL
jgi:hypothetical protein